MADWEKHADSRYCVNGKYTTDLGIAKAWSRIPFIGGAIEENPNWGAPKPVSGGGGDSQSQSASGKNSSSQSQGGDSGNSGDASLSTGDTKSTYGTSGATTVISPSTTINPQSEVRGQSEAANQTNAFTQLEGSQHNEVVGTYNVSGPSQTVYAPVTVDMSDSADSTSTRLTSLDGNTVGLVAMMCVVGAGLYLYTKRAAGRASRATRSRRGRRR